MEEPTPSAWSIAWSLLFRSCCVGVYAHVSVGRALQARGARLDRLDQLVRGRHARAVAEQVEHAHYERLLCGEEGARTGQKLPNGSIPRECNFFF